jgi:hypothetical protein
MVSCIASRPVVEQNIMMEAHGGAQLIYHGPGSRVTGEAQAKIYSSKTCPHDPLLQLGLIFQSPTTSQ